MVAVIGRKVRVPSSDPLLFIAESQDISPNPKAKTSRGTVTLRSLATETLSCLVGRREGLVDSPALTTVALSSSCLVLAGALVRQTRRKTTHARVLAVPQTDAYKDAVSPKKIASRIACEDAQAVVLKFDARARPDVAVDTSFRCVVLTKPR
ncbi:hypothetical protein KPB2_5348 [Klebsiella pneumoniae Kb677]|nr:hypothetical protein KPB2_5348 [Klebsiella pneumoniae Kb677]